MGWQIGFLFKCRWSCFCKWLNGCDGILLPPSRQRTEEKLEKCVVWEHNLITFIWRGRNSVIITHFPSWHLVDCQYLGAAVACKSQFWPKKSILSISHLEVYLWVSSISSTVCVNVKLYTLQATREHRVHWFEWYGHSLVTSWCRARKCFFTPTFTNLSSLLKLFDWGTKQTWDIKGKLPISSW